MTVDTPNNEKQNSGWSRLAFKHAVGTALGAAAVGTIVAGVGIYRRKPFLETMQASAGGALIGAITAVGVGDDIYDKAEKDLRGFTSLFARLRSKPSAERRC
jgi:hypothetical protein